MIIKFFLWDILLHFKLFVWIVHNLFSFLAFLAWLWFISITSCTWYDQWIWVKKNCISLVKIIIFYRIKNGKNLSFLNWYTNTFNRIDFFKILFFYYLYTDRYLKIKAESTQPILSIAIRADISTKKSQTRNIQDTREIWKQRKDNKVNKCSMLSGKIYFLLMEKNAKIRIIFQLTNIILEIN